MYLKGSDWQMNRRRKQRRSNPALILLLLGLIAAVIYFDRFVVAEIPSIAPPTPTATLNPESIWQNARENYEQGNLQRSIELYTQVIQLDPTNDQIYVELARIQVLAGHYEAAQTSASNALLLNPDNPSAHAVLGWTLNFLGNSTEAEQSILTALDLDPESAQAHAYYAEWLVDSQKYDEAKDYASKALQIDPNLLEAHSARAYVYWITGNYELAVEEYKIAIGMSDKIADLHLSLGRVYRDLNLLDQAIDEFGLADSYDPTNPLPVTYTALIYLFTGEYAKAIQFAKQAVTKDPTNPIRWGNLGRAYYSNFQYTESIEAFELAIHGGLTDDNQAVTGLTLNNEISFYFYMYGFSLAETRQCTKAVPIAQAILNAVPGDQIAVDNANEIYNICESYISEVEITPTVEVETTPSASGFLKEQTNLRVW